MVYVIANDSSKRLLKIGLIICLGFGFEAFAEDNVNPAASSAAVPAASEVLGRSLSDVEKKSFVLKRDKSKPDHPEKVVIKGSKVAFHVFIQLESGKVVFDSKRDGRPWTGTVGDGSILNGINDGLYGMGEGGSRSLWIPPHQAYGANGVAPNIPPNAKLYAEITLISIDATEP